ncbi:MAG TPA: hypothetical protein VGL82_08850 [Bryobacteraceae bacterium]
MNYVPQDPLGFDLPLPLRSRYYPLGFPLDIETNSEHILAAADWSWGAFPATGRERGGTLRVVVEHCDARTPPLPSLPRGRDHLVTTVHGSDNFAVCDLARSYTFICLTQDVARNQPYVRYHFLDPAGYMMIDALHLSPVHASCVAWNGRAVLLCGDAGAGKTSLAYACARSGWTYLSDDATHIVRGRADHAVVGRPFRIRFRESARRLFPELKQFVPERRPNGKLDIEVETKALGMTVALESNASHVVFLNRQGDSAHTRVEPFARSEASRRLRGLTCYGDERVRSEQSRALSELLELPTMELTYSDLAGAESALRSLTEREG